MKWREVLQVVVDPGMDHLPPAVSTIVFCLLVMLLCFVMHRLSKVILPGAVREYALDYFKCLAFCTYPLGYGLTRTYHGHIGYVVVMVPINVASLLIMNEGSINPVGNFIDFIKGQQPLWKSMFRTVIQVAGAVSAFYLAKQIMMLEFHGDFAAIVSKACTTDLKIPAMIGFCIEMLGTCWDSWCWGQTWSRYPQLDLILLSTNTALVVSLGVHFTGMYMQPALATGYMFGCHGTTFLELLFVYWAGPFLGGYLAWKGSKKLNVQRFYKEIKTDLQIEPNNNIKTDSKKKSKRNNKKKYY